MKWLNILIERWKSESPKFWKKVLSAAITVGSSAVAVIGAEKVFDLQNYGIPPIIFTIAGYIIVASAAVGLSAKITTNGQSSNFGVSKDIKQDDNVKLDA